MAPVQDFRVRPEELDALSRAVEGEAMALRAEAARFDGGAGLSGSALPDVASATAFLGASTGCDAAAADTARALAAALSVDAEQLRSTVRAYLEVDAANSVTWFGP